MEVVRHTDPREFLTAIDRGDDGFEARNNLVFGVAGTLIERPGLYETFILWTVGADGAVLAAAVHTPPWRPALAETADQDAIRTLAAASGSGTGRSPRRWTTRPRVMSVGTPGSGGRS